MTNLFICYQEDGTVLILDRTKDWDKDPPEWAWDASKTPDIDKNHKGWFQQGRDAKCVRGGKYALLCADGVVALVKRSDGSVPFYSRGGQNAHSAALLPDGNLVTAAAGGYVRVISTDPSVAVDPDKPVCNDYKLPSAHGVVWDKKRKCVWALGSDSRPDANGNAQPFGIVQQYEYNCEKKTPALKLLDSKEYDGKNGVHDFYPSADGKTVLTTFNKHVFVFDPQSWAIDQHPKLFGVPGVKAVSDCANGDAAYTYPTLVKPNDWDTDTVRFFEYQSGITTSKTKKGAAFYKARYWQAASFSESSEQDRDET